MGRRRVEVRKAKNGRWFWHLIAGNGSDILADSGQGYVRKGYAVRMAGLVNPGVKVEVVD